MRFDELGLSPSVLAAVSSLGFSVCTPVQAASIPYFLGHADVCVEAVTGSGKTLAYAVPLVERLLRAGGFGGAPGSSGAQAVGALVVAPTRELAGQIAAVLRTVAANSGLAPPALLVGGSELAADLATLQAGANVLVGTPGRLLDVLRRVAAGEVAGSGCAPLTLRTLEVLVLDEADTLLDMGFADALEEMLHLLPKQRRTGLFSATQTREVRALARAGLRNPVVISVQVQVAQGAREALANDASPVANGAPSLAAGSRAPAPAAAAAAAAAPTATQAVPLSLANYYSTARNPAHKLEQLVAFLRERAAAGDKVIVFVLTCAVVDYYGRAFAEPSVRKAAGLPSVSAFPMLPLHGQLPQKRRTANYAAFLAAPAGVLLCTDVAARGIDVPDVDWIVQYDAPKDPAFYIHRVGRTARAGRAGAALLLLLDKEAAGYLPLLAVKRVPLTERTQAIAPAADAALFGGRSGEGSGAVGEGRFEGELPTAAAASAATAEAPSSLSSVAAAAGGGSRALSLPLVQALLAAAMRDRDILERSTKAFISYIRGYSEHMCSFIFRLEQLDAASLAASFGCVKLPKVNELRALHIHYPGVPGADTGAVAFTDPAREAARLRRLAASAEEDAAFRAARDARRDAARAAGAGGDGSAGAAGSSAAAAPPAAKRKRTHNTYGKQISEEWDVFGAEERLEKRLKAGKISKEEYRAGMAAINRALGLEPEETALLTDAALAGSKAATALAAAPAHKRKVSDNDGSGGSDAEAADEVAADEISDEPAAPAQRRGKSASYMDWRGVIGELPRSRPAKRGSFHHERDMVKRGFKEAKGKKKNGKPSRRK